MNNPDTERPKEAQQAPSPFVVIEHFIVGPVKLEANKLSMPYTVINGGEQYTND